MLYMYMWSVTSTYNHNIHYILTPAASCTYLGIGTYSSELSYSRKTAISISALHSFAMGKLYHHSMSHNPTAAVNIFHVGKQYLTFCKAEAAVTHRPNLIGRKIISNVKHSDARNSLPILDVIRSSDKRHSASKYCK